ncbi:bifunctional DNA primase/polymerase [Streptomyces sp. SAJ15]|uniref:bifunctional DNA primase/polymerase n=1 Tax=Streptomyces sp. SAJ15 TaxID=2011095 RepID=UPI001186F016|nr:bifunctional DNA primase/polymerase [Streptomyces sp. SAJ15]TVL87933.1 hypothetical protein CD790_32325 [Streptomyces sp. SAJ15]
MSRRPRHPRPYATPEGADWLASASPFPRSVRALWAEHPAAQVVLPCGVTFDVISVPALFGRHMVSRLWAYGPGTGPVGAQRDRILIFAMPGCAQRLPALLRWEEWGAATPPLLCHGAGDAVTVPPPHPVEPTMGPGEAATAAAPGPAEDPTDPAWGEMAATAGRPGRRPIAEPAARWLVAPTAGDPWLPGPDVLLWACVRAARATARATGPLAAPTPA